MTKTLLVAASLFATSHAFAQGYMTTVTLDGSDTISSDLTLYPGGGSCPGLEAWSSLGGYWASGTAPTQIQQAIYNAPADSSFDWQISFTESVPSPYGGCYGQSWVTDITLRTTTTFYGPPVTETDYPPLTVFTCTYGSLACTSGTPTCTQDNSTTIVLGSHCPVPLEGEGRGAAYLVVNGSCEFGFLYPAIARTPPRKCT